MSQLSQLSSQLDDMTTGRNDWQNVQAPVRLALVTLLTATLSQNELSPNDATTNATNVWKEMTLIREKLATKATRVEVAESLRTKADRSTVHHLRSTIGNKQTQIINEQLEHQRNLHFVKHDDLVRAEMDGIKTRVKNLQDQFTSVQFDIRLESMETRMTEYRKRRRNTAEKLSKLVANVRANSTQQAETASLFLSGVARLRETLENVQVSLHHKADGAHVRKELATKANTNDLEALEHAVSSKALGDRFVTFETRLSMFEQASRTNQQEQDTSVRTVKGIASDMERLQTSVEKQVERVLKQMEVIQIESEKNKIDDASKQNETERASSSINRRLNQIEEEQSKIKPRLHDMHREQSREKTRIEANHDQIEKTHTTLNQMTRDVERLKKTMVHVERVHAKHGNQGSQNNKKANATSGSGLPGLVISNELKVQVDGLLSDMKNWSSRTKTNERQIKDLHATILTSKNNLEKNTDTMVDSFRVAAEERAELQGRCGALETGIRSSLLALSKPPSLKSLRSETKSNRSHRSRKSHRSGHSRHHNRQGTHHRHHHEKGAKHHHHKHHHQSEDREENEDSTSNIVLDDELHVDTDEDRFEGTTEITDEEIMNESGRMI